jgi:hypothetical protein
VSSFERFREKAGGVAGLSLRQIIECIQEIEEDVEIVFEEFVSEFGESVAK